MEEWKVNSLYNAAQIFHYTVLAQIEFEAMKAENTQKEIEGKSLPYGEEAFRKIYDNLENTINKFR